MAKHPYSYGQQATAARPLAFPFPSHWFLGGKNIGTKTLLCQVSYRAIQLIKIYFSFINFKTKLFLVSFPNREKARQIADQTLTASFSPHNRN